MCEVQSWNKWIVFKAMDEGGPEKIISIRTINHPMRWVSRLLNSSKLQFLSSCAHPYPSSMALKAHGFFLLVFCDHAFFFMCVFWDILFLLCGEYPTCSKIFLWRTANFSLDHQNTWLSILQMLWKLHDRMWPDGGTQLAFLIASTPESWQDLTNCSHGMITLHSDSTFSCLLNLKAVKGSRLAHWCVTWNFLDS